MELPFPTTCRRTLGFKKLQTRPLSGIRAKAWVSKVIGFTLHETHLRHLLSTVLHQLPSGGGHFTRELLCRNPRLKDLTQKHPKAGTAPRKLFGQNAPGENPDKSTQVCFIHVEPLLFFGGVLTS